MKADQLDQSQQPRIFRWFYRKYSTNNSITSLCGSLPFLVCNAFCYYFYLPVTYSTNIRVVSCTQYFQHAYAHTRCRTVLLSYKYTGDQDPILYTSKTKAPSVWNPLTFVQASCHIFKRNYKPFSRTYHSS